MQRFLVGSQDTSHLHEYPNSGIIKQRPSDGRPSGGTACMFRTARPRMPSTARGRSADAPPRDTEEGFSVEWSLGFTDSRPLNIPAQLDLEAAGYYAQK
jgi:hypothetical protein